jgi:SAM-dependent methyltransferase
MQSIAVYEAYRELARASAAGQIFDVGCGQGGSTIAFALGLLDRGRDAARLVSAFDQFYQEVSGPHPFNRRDHPRDAAEKNLAAFRANLAAFGVEDLVRPTPGALTEGGFGAEFDGLEVAILCLDTDGYIDRDFALFFDRVAPGGTVIIDDYADTVNRHGRKTLEMARGLPESELAAFVARMEGDHLRGGGRLLGKHLLTWRLARLFVEAGLAEEIRRIENTLFLRKATARRFAEADLAAPIAAVKAAIRAEFLARAGAATP